MAEIFSRNNTFSNDTPIPYIKVASASRPPAVAGAIAGMVRDGRQTEIQAIGAGAVNQAAKALAIARVYLQKEGIHITFAPYFAELALDGHDRTAVCFSVLRCEPKE